MKDINKIINHPDIQRVVLLSKILDETNQQIEVWRTRGVSDRGMEKIEKSDILNKLDFNKKKLSSFDIKKKQKKAIDFINKLDLNIAAEKTGASIVSLRMCRCRGGVTLNIARKLNESMNIPFSVSRPDVPLLAFECGIELWRRPKQD